MRSRRTTYDGAPMVLSDRTIRRLIEEGPFPAWVIGIYLVSVVAVAGLWLNVAGVPNPPGVTT